MSWTLRLPGYKEDSRESLWMSSRVKLVDIEAEVWAELQVRTIVCKLLIMALRIQSNNNSEIMMVRLIREN